MPTNPEVIHIVRVGGGIDQQFLAVDWYDTATPFLGCLRQLQRLDNLATTTTLEITSNGVLYRIDNQTDFRQWVTKIFERGVDFGFTKRLK